MTTQVVTDEQLGAFARRQNDLFRRARDGSVPYDQTMNGLQLLVEGKPITEWPCLWQEENGVIYFTVTSNGLTGAKWIKRFKEMGITVSDIAKQVILSPDFWPIKKGVKKDIAVLKRSRITANFRAEAKHLGLVEPSPEIACLIRVAFTDEEIKQMGLDWIVAMHNPIKDAKGNCHLLGAGRFREQPWLIEFRDNPCGVHDDLGAAFVVPSSSAPAVAS